MKRFGLFFFTSVLVVSMMMLFSFPAVSNAASMAEAKKLFEQRADVEKAKKGISMFQKIQEDDPKNLEAFELGSRLTVYLAMDLGANEETQMDAFEYMAIASDMTDEWIKVAPNSAAANFWKAYAAAASKDIKTALTYGQKSYEIDKTYLNGMPALVMGYLKGKLPPFLGGDKVASYKFIDEAMEAAPDNLMIHRIKATLLVDDLKAAAQKALVHLQFVMESEAPKGWEPEARRDKQAATDFMKQYGEAMKTLAK
ncbi:MAG: hypothetical protein SVY10_04805 [Thermodesulfobacteriota bacterium]|nr:hypothetical protein [Thermodesulfobacteriota bacterium]